MDAHFEHIFSLAKPYLDTRHNLVHTEIVTRFAEQIAGVEGADLDVVIPAAILHDVGWSKIPEDLQLTAFGPNATNLDLNRAHEIEGVAIANTILDEVDYPEIYSGHILRIIDKHDSEPGFSSLEEAVVKDADKLWRYSKTGFHIDCTRFELTPPESTRRLRAKLPHWFLTETGIKMAHEELAKREREHPAL